MKITIVSLLSTTLLLFSVGGAHAGAPPSGLVSYWSADGNPLDSIGAHNGTLLGSVIYSDGMRNQAFDFTPSSRVAISDHPDFVTPSFTISGWLYPRVWGGFVLHRGDNRPGFDSYVLDLYTAGKLSFSMSDQAGDWIKIDAPIQLNDWVYFAATFDDVSGAMRIYTNGVLANNITTFSRPFIALDSSQDAGIGLGNHSGTSHSFSLDGKLDEISIYARALTSAEIAALPQYQPCTPHAAKATARVDSGFVVEAKLTDSGCGYTNPPKLEIVGGGGNGAAAIAVVENGVVKSITITSAGFGYSTTPQVLIASPPFAPWLDIAVSKVKVTQHVVLGKSYILEASTDLSFWTQVGSQFTAQEEVIVQEFDVVEVGRFFRIHEVP